MSTPAEIILGDLGATSVSVASLTGQSIVVTPLGSTSVSVSDPVSTQSISISSSSTEVTVASPSVDPISVSTDTIRVDINTNPVDTGARRLRQLTDVVGDPTSGQVLVYNESENNFQFSDQQGGSGGGADELTDYAITVTNTDAAFNTINGFTYETFSSMTNILNDILNPYVKTSITLNSLSGTLNGSSFSQDTPGRDLEVGESIVFNTISYTVGDASKVKDDTIRLKRDNLSHQDLPETGTSSVAISPIINTTFSSPETDVYKISFVDNGNPNGLEFNLSSQTITLNWKHRVTLTFSPTIPSTNSEATTLFGQPSSDSQLLNDPGSASFVLTASSDNAQDGNHTFLMYPSEYGTLNSIRQNDATDTTADFVLAGTFTITNSYGVNIPYYIYRTIDTGAFNNGVDLRITLN